MPTSPDKKTMPEQLEFGIVARENNTPKLPTKADAEALANKLTRRFARHFQQMRDPVMLLSGHDSGLKSAWDEICVQQQAFESVDWRVHRRMLEALITGVVEALGPVEKQTLWLLTDDGWSWHYDVSHGFDADEDEAIPVDEGLVQMLATRTLSYASDYSNVRIQKYLDRAY